MASRELAALLPKLRGNPFDLKASPAVLRDGLDQMADLFPIVDGPAPEIVTLGGVAAEHMRFGADGPAILFIHGGGFVIGSPRSHRHLAARLAEEVGGEIYVLDYRLAPEAPCPAALVDVVAAYEALVSAHPPHGVTLVGDSAGGGLVFSAAVAIRDRGLPPPNALVAISPWVNLGTGNPSYERLAQADPMLSRAVTDYFSSRYLAGRPADDPAASPLFAELLGLPPTLIQVGDRECFLGDAVDIHQRLIEARVDTELRVWKKMFHVWHLYWPMLPEGREAIAEAAAFIRAHARQTVKASA